MSEPLPVGKLTSEQLRALLAGLPAAPSVVQGPGVGLDVAVVDSGGPHLLLLKSDPITFCTHDPGRHAVQVNANDIACAGGAPRWFLATLLLPEGRTTEGEAAALFEQLSRACAEMDICLVGGHTEITAGLERPIVCGTMVGEVGRDRLVTPGGMQAGDVVLLTRPVAIEGTATLAAECRSKLLALGCPRALLDRCRAMLQDPGIGVLSAARALCEATPVHAMHDPTEGGVATALWELAEASGRAIRVHEAGIPVLPETADLCARLGLDPLGLLASGSLLVAVPPDEVATALAACAERGVPCTAVGEVIAEEPGVWVMGPGGREPLPRFDQDEITRVL